MLNLIEIIKDTLSLISKGFKRVLKYLQYLSRQYRCVFPSIERIASTCRVSRATVDRALRYFRDAGFLVTKRRPYRANLYFLDAGLINLDLDDVSLMMKKEPIPLVNDAIDDAIVHSSCSAFSKVPREVPIPMILSDLKKVHDADKRRLAQKWPEFALYEAVNDARWYIRGGNRIKDMTGYLWAQCKYHVDKMKNKQTR